MKCLIVKPSSLGDILHAFPAVNALAANIPDPEISWLVNPSFANLLEYLPCVNGRIIEFERKKLGSVMTFPGAFFKLAGDLRREKFDCVIDLQGLMRSAFFGRLAIAKDYYGPLVPKEKAALAFYSKKLSYPSSAVHAVEKNNGMISNFLGSTPSFDFEAPVLEKNLETAKRLFSNGVLPQRFVAVAPGARWDSKKWPASFFAGIINRLAATYKDLSFVILGTKDDAHSAAEIIRLSPSANAVTYDLCDKTSVGELFEIIRLASVLVCNDSGPMHIGALVKTPVAAFFGSTSPDMTGPYCEIKSILQPSLDCICCFKRYCDKMYCHTALSVDDAFVCICDIIR